MRIKKLELTNFKRFTQLTIDLSNLTHPPKLVLLIGTNGSGKSGVFDAFEALGSWRKDSPYNQEAIYYRKKRDETFLLRIEDFQGNWLQAKSGSLDKSSEFTDSKSFYGRSSLRQVPFLDRKTIGQQAYLDFEKDTDRPRRYIDRDERFENDLEKITELILKEIYRSDAEQKTSDIKARYVEPINQAFGNIFGADSPTRLRLIELTPPLEGKVAQVIFQKGEAEIHYDLLSSGEKEVFNVLINLLSRRHLYQDTIYFFDELDLHLNTKLQFGLLKEIVENWIPENCQLWTASHSLGFIDYANQSDQAVIIDFDDLNFDLPQTLKPSEKNNFDVFEIAVSKEFLADIFKGKQLFFAENKDTELYNNLRLRDTIFIRADNKNDVFYKAKNPSYKGLMDRDFLTDEEIKIIQKKFPDLYVLSYYSIENYLFHPENLAEYHRNQGRNFSLMEYTQKIVDTKNKYLLKLVATLQTSRNTYAFLRVPEFKDKEKKAFKSGYEEVISMLESNEFETFYKVFPMKDYATQIPERQNLRKTDLALTAWFKTQINSLLSL